MNPTPCPVCTTTRPPTPTPDSLTVLRAALAGMSNPGRRTR